MKNARLIAEHETNACTVRVYFENESQNYYMTCISGTRNDVRMFGPFKQSYLDNLIECLKDVKDMKGKHYFIDAPPLVDMLSKHTWSVSQTLIEVIRDLVPDKGIILELGSGEGTEELAKYFTVFSIEHDPEWIGRYKSNYIYAPLVPHKPVAGFGDEEAMWYDPEAIRGKLPHSYDLILVDGPPKTRSGFIKYFELFKSNVPIIFDDVNRKSEMALITKVAARLSKPFTVYDAHTDKHWGVIS